MPATSVIPTPGSVLDTIIHHRHSDLLTPENRFGSIPPPVTSADFSLGLHALNMCRRLKENATITANVTAVIGEPYNKANESLHSNHPNNPDGTDAHKCKTCKTVTTKLIGTVEGLAAIRDQLITEVEELVAVRESIIYENKRALAENERILADNRYLKDLRHVVLGNVRPVDQESMQPDVSLVKGHTASLDSSHSTTTFLNSRLVKSLNRLTGRAPLNDNPRSNLVRAVAAQLEKRLKGIVPTPAAVVKAASKATMSRP